MKKLQVIGWRERIDLPDWGIRGLLAKSDTGANSSAIDVAWFEELPGDRVRFGVRRSRKYPDRVKEIEADIARKTRVRSSNGESVERIVVATMIRVGPVSKEVEFSLVCRKEMLCRVLLGRKAIEGDFLVDCSERHLHANSPNRASRSSK